MPSFMLKYEYFIRWNGWKIFLLLTGITVLTTFTINDFFLTEGLYYQSFGEKLAADRIAKVIELTMKWQWIGYITTSVVIMIRICFAALCIYIGCFLGNFNIKYNDLFKIALVSDFVFVIAALTKLGILFLFKQVSVLDDLQFQPLSLLELFGKGTVDSFLIYPYSLISVFELLYWFVLAWLLSHVINRSFFNALKMVALSYGLGLFLWVLFVVFISLNLT
ncbi:MAG: hypothetical protein Q8T04_18040 [Bacteroidota bacterium]|nr:hypothetical protein [Bacteroidota bacterium]